MKPWKWKLAWGRKRNGACQYPANGWCVCKPFSKNCSRPLPTREQELRNHKLRSGRTLGRGPDLGEPRRKRWGKKQSDARRRARAKGI